MGETTVLKPARPRAAGLDLVRCVAFFFVPAVHFFLNNGYYDAPLVGGTLFVFTALRWLFFACVPLFLLLTGYLLRHKTPTLAYYLKFLRIVFEYLVACVLCNLVRIFLLGQTVSLRDWLRGIVRFSAAPYSWYIALYFCLFLLVPFLNLAYSGLKTRRQKKLLLATLFFLTALPTFFNGIVHIFPDNFVAIWPLTYYFFGCYFAEYQPKIHRLPALFTIAILAVGQAFLSFWSAKGGAFSWAVPDGYGAAPTVILSVLTFLILYQVSLPKFLQKPAEIISDCSLSAYLLSWAFDVQIYPLLFAAYPTVLGRLPWMIVVVPMVIVCAIVAALPVRWAWQKLSRSALKLSTPPQNKP